MRIAVVTSTADALGGVLATAYRAAGGPAPALVIVLPSRSDLRHPVWARGWVALRLLGASGTLRLASARGLRWPLRGADRGLGVHRRWPAALCDADTRVVRAAALAGETRDLLVEAAPDLLVSIGAPVVIGPDVLTIARLGAINIHNGHLPTYRGHFGTFWEVSRGEEWAYVSIHEMTVKVDRGRLLACDRMRIRDAVSFLDLMIFKKRRGGELLARVVADIGARQALPVTAGTDEEPRGRDGYFGFPSLTDVRAFSWPRSLSLGGRST